MKMNLTSFDWRGIFFALSFSITLSGPATAAPSAPPPAGEFIEARLRDCVFYERKSIEACEHDLKARYLKTPYMSGKQFLEKLNGDKTYLKNLTVIDSKRLSKITAELLRLPIDRFNEVDGCMERAETIAYYLMKRHKITVGHVHASGHIRVRSIHIPLENTSIRWGFHIAPFVMVRDADGGISPYSLDLTLLNGTPRPLNEWLDLLERESPFFLELHALKAFENSPHEPGMTPVRSWRDRDTSSIEERLSGTPVQIVHRGSPVRADLGAEFLRVLEASPLQIVNPYERELNPAKPLSFQEAFPPALRELLRSRILSELRCEGNEPLRCAVYYRDEMDHGFCQIEIEFPRAADQNGLIIPCLPFDR